MKSVMKKIYIALIILFLYAPIGTLIVLSFNESRTRAKWGGFTFQWYVSLFQNEEILRALLNTLLIAFLSSLAATVVGTVACIAMMSMKRRTKSILMGITNIPMLNADIVTGISLMLLYISLGIRFGIGTILLSHITFNIPYVILSVMPRVKQLNLSTYEAARLHAMKSVMKKIYIALIILFLYAPIGTLIVLSFNESRTRAKWGGFTFQWYVSLFQNEEILRALLNTLLIAFLSSLAATVVGTVACIAMMSMKRRTKSILMGITNIPMLNADIVTGISLMLLYISLGIRFGIGTILLSHITFNIPYVILSVMPRVKQLNLSTYEAALDLGASHLNAFFKVVLPDLMPGILSGFLMAFTMSLDDFIITHFTKGVGVDTLSTKIYTEIKKGIKPEMYALSALIFITVLTLLILINLSPADKNKGSV